MVHGTRWKHEGSVVMTPRATGPEIKEGRADTGQDLGNLTRGRSGSAYLARVGQTGKGEREDTPGRSMSSKRAGSKESKRTGAKQSNRTGAKE